jgi:hypothetical protein
VWVQQAKSTTQSKREEQDEATLESFLKVADQGILRHNNRDCIGDSMTTL